MVRTKDQSGKTRELMLEAAIKAIEEGGEQSIRTKAIAESAGVTEPSLFHFFGSRDGLVQAAQIERYSRGIAQMFNYFHDAVMKCDTREEFIAVARDGLELGLAPHRDVNRATRISVLGSTMSRPEMREPLRVSQAEQFKILESTIEYAKERGWVPSTVDAAVFAAWVPSMSTGRVVAEIMGDDELLARWNEAAISATLHLLGVEQPVATRSLPR